MGKMDNTAIIGFAGFCKSDIILYLSRILYLLGEKVAIIDRSNEHEICFSVPAEIKNTDMIEYRGVDVFPYCHNMPVNCFLVKNYSCILIDFGINPETYNDIKHLKVLFIVTDPNRYHTIPLSAWLEGITAKPDAVRIIRDTVYGKIRPKYIDSLLKAGEVANIIAEYEFPLDDIEYATRLTAQYDDIFRFTGISREMKDMLTDSLTEIFKKDRKAVSKALKKAQRGW